MPFSSALQHKRALKRRGSFRLARWGSGRCCRFVQIKPFCHNYRQQTGGCTYQSSHPIVLYQTVGITADQLPANQSSQAHGGGLHR